MKERVERLCALVLSTNICEVNEREEWVFMVMGSLACFLLKI